MGVERGDHPRRFGQLSRCEAVMLIVIVKGVFTGHVPLFGAQGEPFASLNLVRRNLVAILNHQSQIGCAVALPCCAAARCHSIASRKTCLTLQPF